MIRRTKIKQQSINKLVLNNIDDTLDAYFAIDKRVLKLGQTLKFKLYKFINEENLVLFLQSFTKIDKDFYKQIQELEEIFIKKTDKHKYDAYLEKNIQDILQNQTLSMEEKTDIVYESSTELTQSLFENPNALKNAKRSENIVEPVLESILYHDNTVSSYMKIIEYDYYTHTHSLNVSIYALCLGAWLKLTEDRLRLLGRSALLHDLGKSKIDSKIVNKPAKLTPEEFEIMKSHPNFGHLNALKIGLEDKNILDGIKHHHEKLNGKGYPDGLKGEEITLFPRIIAVCDIFDALTTKRTYKDGMSSFDALNLMKKELHEDLDMRIVNEFIKMLHK